MLFFLSGSCERGEKTRKLEHLLNLLESGAISEKLSSVLLVDDCPYETEAQFVQSVAVLLKEQYQISLTVLPVDRFGYVQSSQVLRGVVPVDELLIQNATPRRWSLTNARDERDNLVPHAAVRSAFR